MKIYIKSEGDLLEEIEPDFIDLDWNMPFEFLNEKIDREKIRKFLIETFFKFCENGPIKIWFEDECCDCCTKLGKNSKCQNKNCHNCVK